MPYPVYRIFFSPTFLDLAQDRKSVVLANLGDQTVVTAMDLDGKIRWQTPNGKAWKDPVPGVRGTPTIDGERLYHESPHGAPLKWPVFKRPSLAGFDRPMTYMNLFFVKISGQAR